MGLSIHYSGRFNKKAVLADMINEVREIAEVFKWDYFIYETSFPEQNDNQDEYNEEIFGIAFTPPGCETVNICFLSNYRMSSLVHLKFHGNPKNEKQKDLLYTLSVKTQFAGIKTHKILIELFRHLHKKNYFSEFSLLDEGEYWETGSEKVLENKFKIYNALIDNFTVAMETIPIQQGESYENYLMRIMQQVKDRQKDI